jgi:cytochrome c553
LALPRLAIWRPLVIALAAAAFCATAAAAQDLSLAERVEQCGGCHGPDGNSKLENVPSLAGQPEFFLLNQLILMREGVRRIEAMAPFVKNLKDSDIEALSKHFARLEPKPSNEAVDPALVRRGAALAISLRCSSCHLPTLAGQEQMPRLAKQRIDYMVYAMKAFRDNQRSGADTAMTATIYGVGDADLLAIAHYAASR